MVVYKVLPLRCILSFQLFQKLLSAMLIFTISAHGFNRGIKIENHLHPPLAKHSLARGGEYYRYLPLYPQLKLWANISNIWEISGNNQPFLRKKTGSAKLGKFKWRWNCKHISRQKIKFNPKGRARIFTFKGRTV